MWRQLGPPRAAVPPPPLTPPALGSSLPWAPLRHGPRGKSSRRRGRNGRSRSTVGKGLPAPLGGTATAGAGRGAGRTNENWPCVGVQGGGVGPAWRRAGTTTPHHAITSSTTPRHSRPPARTPTRSAKQGRPSARPQRPGHPGQVRPSAVLEGDLRGRVDFGGGLERSTSGPDQRVGEDRCDSGGRA